MRPAFSATPAVLLVLVACASASGAERRAQELPPPPPSAPGRIIDSLLPIAEEIRRFREAVPEVPPRLSGGERSRTELIHRWVRAVETRDSTELAEMLVNAAEFITFYYPESKYTRPPYRQKPSLRWFLMATASSQGAARVWQRHGGLPLAYAGYRCDPVPEVVGHNRIWTNCVVTLQRGPEKLERRLFGPILERDGEYKFLSYGTDY